MSHVAWHGRRICRFTGWHRLITEGKASLPDSAGASAGHARRAMPGVPCPACHSQLPSDARPPPPRIHADTPSGGVDDGAHVSEREELWERVVDSD
jgi:hypothetical protein